MTRFFGGMGGGGAGSRFGGKNDKKSALSGSSFERAMAAKNGQGKKNPANMTAEERYQALVEQKMNAQKERLQQTKKYSHQMPGVAPMEKEMSKSAQMALELMAAKMAKREMKHKSKPKDIEIKPTPIGGAYGGYIDAKGRIYGAGNHLVLQIDKRTGDIKTTGFFGRKVGKYDPKSPYCFHKIQQHLEKAAIKNGYAKNNIWGDSGGKKDSGAAGIYGSNGWGGGSDNNNGGGTGWW